MLISTRTVLVPVTEDTYGDSTTSIAVLYPNSMLKNILFSVTNISFPNVLTRLKNFLPEIDNFRKIATNNWSFGKSWIIIFDTMTITDKAIEEKLEDETYIGEEDSEVWEEGSEVANGRHVVPKGVAVEELKNYNGQKKLRDECPEDVAELLLQKDAGDIYDKFVTAIAETRNVRGSLRGWKDAQFVSVLDLYADEFADKHIKVALCKRRSGRRTYRWLEYIDVEKVGKYVPQYDVANMSGQVIKTYYTKIKFPNGVAVEELKKWKGRKKLKESIPIYVEKMMNKKDSMNEYNQLVDHCIEAGVGKNSKNWKINKLNDIMKVYKPMFQSKGIDVFVCHKDEYVSHGQHGGHMEHFRWIEFVDREEQPNYYPQRDADTKKEECSIM